LQFLNRQWHGKKESTVAVFRPGGRPSQAISTAEEKEERRSVSGGLHETFNAKREKQQKNEERTNKQTDADSLHSQCGHKKCAKSSKEEERRRRRQDFTKKQATKKLKKSSLEKSRQRDDKEAARMV
jgi:hypothetical protein